MMYANGVPLTRVEIKETKVFKRRSEKILDDDEHGELLLQLAGRPDCGKVIPGTGGLRKLRFAAQGRGKRGGARIIYYFRVQPGLILLLYAFAKNERADLSKKELKVLREAVRMELGV